MGGVSGAGAGRPVSRERRAVRAEFGPVLAALRQRAGLSQMGLDEAAGLSVGYVCRIESGRRVPTVEGVARLADALGLTGRRRGLLLLAAGHAPGGMRRQAMRELTAEEVRP